jgi:hypothetical protein
MAVLPFISLPSSAQNAYAQLFDAALSAEHIRSVADLSGSFAAKTVRGQRYWYFQYTQPSGALTQHYVGPDNERVQKLIERARHSGASTALGPLMKSAHALGCATILPRHARVLRRLGEYGFFKAGGLLIGTHAFVAYGNMLGVKWGSQDLTLDIDFAPAGRSLALALPSNLTVQTHDAIESLDMGFLPITHLSGKTGGSFLIPREPEFRLDFLTPRHRGGGEPFLHPQLNVVLQPLPYMEFSMECVEQAVVFSRNEAIVVNVPDPARFALHKLIVFGERRGAFRAKAPKDLSQAACLIAYLWANSPATLQEALEDLQSRGPHWRKAFKVGVQALLASFPEIAGLANLRAAFGAT